LNELTERIAAEIKNRGVISFAEFMSMALYCPNYGFYEREKDKIGRKGDFYTSVTVGEVFGELLAFQFSEWLGEWDSEMIAPTGTRAKRKPKRASRIEGMAERPRRLKLIEAGAHNGQLARDVLVWLGRNRPDLLEKLEYVIIEPSARRLEWQRKTLREFAGHVRWISDVNELHHPQGIIFSNELLDSMPVHRVSWSARNRKWFEWGVVCDHGRFEWARIPAAINETHSESARNPLTPTAAASLPRWLRLDETWLGQLPGKLLDVLPDGFTTELCPQAEQWWSAAGRILHRGRLMTIDYGLTLEELLAPERKEGTLRAYRKHRLSSGPLANPGEQDLTAHVNFTALQKQGEDAGLKTEIFTPQSRFLTGILAKMRSRQRTPDNWDSGKVRQFQTLTNPVHLGQSFRVLVQSRMECGKPERPSAIHSSSPFNEFDPKPR
jgi:SAM-dependent MidA family methyltransferase